jgi:hypothetical protein
MISHTSTLISYWQARHAFLPLNLNPQPWNDATGIDKLLQWCQAVVAQPKLVLAAVEYARIALALVQRHKALSTQSPPSPRRTLAQSESDRAATRRIYGATIWNEIRATSDDSHGGACRAATRQVALEFEHFVLARSSNVVDELDQFDLLQCNFRSRWSHSFHTHSHTPFKNWFSSFVARSICGTFANTNA